MRQSRRYRSQVRQSLHYFARPHTHVMREPIASAAAWKGPELAGRDDWQHHFSADELEEISVAITSAKATGKPTGALSSADFPLPNLARQVTGWRNELAEGRGFLLLRGLPVREWPQEDVERFFWCFGLHLGEPGAQNPQGDLLGHVRDDGSDPNDPTVRQYRTTENIRYHCDAADVVGLLCLHGALRGGASRIVSSVSVYNALLERRPDLVERLYEPLLLDTHGEGGVWTIPINPCRFDGEQLRTFYHAGYFRSSRRYDFVPPASPLEQELLNTYDEITNSADYYLDMVFEPGDIQLVSNHTILHARTAYEDHPDPARKRHLLRLWLSLPGRLSFSNRLLKEQSRVAVVHRLVRSWLTQRKWI